MSAGVAIVDYGVGNLLSVSRAFERAEARVEISDDPATLLAAERLVLPGVGAFGNGMQGLVERGLDSVIHTFAESGKPLLGICLGMQMLATASEEFGEHRGLGIIPGRVRAIPPTGATGQPHKIPHIGWAALRPGSAGVSWSGTILESVHADDAVYLVHSFELQPDDPDQRLAACDYNGRSITAAVRKANVYGVQFHPEKSGEVGLRIIEAFLDAPAPRTTSSVAP